MAEWRTFAIDQAIALLGDHGDKAASGGRFYSNKAPGLSFAAYPVYVALRAVLPRPRSGTFDPIFLAVRFLTVSLASILALRLLARRIAAEARDESVAALVVLAVAFGTPMLFYARSFFSHAWTASLLFVAWELLRRDGSTGVPPSRWTVVLAGFLAASPRSPSTPPHRSPCCWRFGPPWERPAAGSSTSGSAPFPRSRC